ncbi:MAG: NAD+ synthase, partial [Pseudomonadota bacterium]
VGAQDDQMFDGGSFVLNPGGGLVAQMAFFEEQTFHIDFDRTAEGWRCREAEKANLPDDWEADYRVMVETVRGYFAKSGFTQALLGLSGGVDSALTATIAADALGPDNVRCVMLPSRFTSDESLEDAAAVAKLLGCQLDTLPIGDGVDAIEASLAPLFGAAPRDITEENIQSRLRGLYLMALSNKTGALLLTTGNKSEVAVGYATLYGDMCGAYNPLKDLYKTRVFETCRWRNANHRPWMMGPSGEVMPSRVIDKPPTAELREDQKDEDSLPPYERLDVILEGLIERDLSVADLVEEGFDRAEVARVERLIYTSEYKRFQSAMGTKLTQKAFWLDRRYPITNRWRSG